MFRCRYFLMKNAPLETTTDVFEWQTRRCCDEVLALHFEAGIGMGIHRTLIRCKWGLVALTTGLIGSCGSLTIIYTLSAKGQWFPRSAFGQLLYSVTGGLGVIGLVLVFVGSWRDKWPWLSLVAIPPSVLCLLIVAR